MPPVPVQSHLQLYEMQSDVHIRATPFSSALPLEVGLGPLNTARGSGECCNLTQRKSNFVHSSFKIWHLVASNLLIFLRINWPQCVTDSTPLNLPNCSDVALRRPYSSFRFIIQLSFHAWFSTTFHSVYVLVSFSVVNCYYFGYIVYLMRIKIVTNLWWRYLSMQSLGGSSNSFHFFLFGARCKMNFPLY